MKIGIVKATNAATAAIENRAPAAKRSTKDQEKHTTTNCGIEPDRVDGSTGMPVDALDPEGERKAVVSGVSKRHTGGSNLESRSAGLLETRVWSPNHASLSHAEGAHDRQSQESDGGLPW